MSPEQWERVKEIADAALKLPAAERSQYVRQMAKGDSVVASEVQSLLQAEAGGSLTAILNPDSPVLSDLGPYEIKDLIGVGGMGRVYRARDRRLGRDVAIKFLSADFMTDAERLRRFRQEARATSALNHPNIVTIY